MCALHANYREQPRFGQKVFQLPRGGGRCPKDASQGKVRFFLISAKKAKRRHDQLVGGVEPREGNKDETRPNETRK